jgi:acyl-CoA thioesterase FadM
VANPRRPRHKFEIRDDNSDQLLAEGFVRVACVSVETFQPRDLPHDVVQILTGLSDLAVRQARGELELPWT